MGVDNMTLKAHEKKTGQNQCPSKIRQPFSQGVMEKWQNIYLDSVKSDTLQEVVADVGKPQPSTGDRKDEVYKSGNDWSSWF